MTGHRLLPTVAASIALHLLVALAIALPPHVGAPWVDPARPAASVELVMEERKGDLRPDAPPPPPPAPAQTESPRASPAAPPPSPPEPPAAAISPPPPDSRPEPSRTEHARSEPLRPQQPQPEETGPEPSRTAHTQPEEPRPEQARPEESRPEPARPEQAQPEKLQPGHARPEPPPDTPRPQPRPDPAPETPSPPKSVEKTRIAEAPPPIITLRGTDSPSDAIAQGNHIVPASPDAVFHNRPPEYPPEAARRGQGGEVFLTIHISPGGKPTAVDVTRGSGYILLDHAAREAVLRWRFLPAVKDGQPVGSAMTIRFHFDNK